MKFFKYINEQLEEMVRIVRDDDLNLYTVDDFKCKCGCGVSVSPRDPWVDFMNYLLRKTSIYFTINSGYRCKTHNKKIGGSLDSDHTKGLAIDIATPTIESRSILVYNAFHFGIQRAIVYTDKKFVHLSTNPGLTNPILLFNRRGVVY